MVTIQSNDLLNWAEWWLCAVQWKQKGVTYVSLTPQKLCSRFIARDFSFLPTSVYFRSKETFLPLSLEVSNFADYVRDSLKGTVSKIDQQDLLLVCLLPWQRHCLLPLQGNSLSFISVYLPGAQHYSESFHTKDMRNKADPTWEGCTRSLKSLSLQLPHIYRLKPTQHRWQF